MREEGGVVTTSQLIIFLGVENLALQIGFYNGPTCTKEMYTKSILAQILVGREPQIGLLFQNPLFRYIT
jgi:hypothetical protein